MGYMYLQGINIYVDTFSSISRILRKRRVSSGSSF